MADNVTTVPGLPDADFETTGFPTQNVLYIVQGTGADRDRKVTAEDFFEWLISKKAMTTDLVYTRAGDIQFKMEETRGGRLMTAYILDGRTLEKPSVTGGMTVSGGMKVDSVEGTNQGQGTTKYLILGNTTVNGDLDVKYKAMLGNGLVVADPDEQKETVDGDLEVSGKVAAGNFETAGNVKADVVRAKTFALPKSGTAPYEGVSAECVKSSSENCEPPYSGGVGTIGFVHNSGSAQIKVYLGYREDGKRRYVNLNAGCCGAFMCLSTTDSGGYTVPLFNAVVQAE